MDDLRENIQLEKLRALKPLNSLAEPLHQMKAGLNSTKMDPKAMGKELADEVPLTLLSRDLFRCQLSPPRFLTPSFSLTSNYNNIFNPSPPHTLFVHL